MSEFSLAVVTSALDGLAARQRIIAANIANSETPGYLAKRVNFEDSLRSAIGARDISQYGGVSTAQTTDATLPNGNNVQLDAETVNLTETNLKYQLMTDAVNNEFHILHTSMRRDS